MQQDQRSDDDVRLHGLDRLTQRAAVAVSRRGFVKRLSVLGAAVGLGMAATTRNAAACTDTYYKYRTTYGTCGSCSATSTGSRRQRYDQRRACRVCTGGEICGSWTTYQTTCVYC